MKSMRPARKGFSPRRKALLGLLLLLVAYVAYGYYTGLAATTGMPTTEMDWDGDGAVTQQEIMQGFYAVAARKTVDGNRECRTYYWLGSGQAIRVSCRTVVNAAKQD